MAAIAYVWNERKQIKTPVRNKVSTEKITSHTFRVAQHLNVSFVTGVVSAHLVKKKMCLHIAE